MRKVIVIMLALVMTFSVLPVSYAYWTGQLGNWHLQLPIVLANGQYSMVFTSEFAYDNEDSLPEPKDVAQITASITDGGKKIETVITNAYPGYEGSVDFTVTNTGSGAIEITNITIDNPNPDELEVSISLDLGVLDPGQSRNGLLVQGVTQQASQGATSTYTFTIEMEVQQYPPLNGISL